MTITVSTADKRSVKALAILATSARWIRGHRKADGRSFWLIPSASDPSRVYMVDTRECTCPDFIHRGATCAHILAARLRVAQLNAARPKTRRQKLAGLATDIWGHDGE
jgi:predicted nucleic acid-binding Zn finger protein